MENPIMENNVVNFIPKTKSSAPGLETTPFDQVVNIAVVTDIKDNIPISVVLHEIRYPVIGYLSVMPGLAPSVSIGDNVLISAVAEGVLILGVVMPVDAPVRASFGFKDDKLLIEARGAVILKSGNATVELTEAGEIRIDDKDVRTVAKETLTLLGGKVELN